MSLLASATSLRTAIAQVLLAGDGVEPDDLVGVVIELLGRLVALGGILPDRIVRLVEEEARVAGIFGIDVDLAGRDRLAHDRGGAELDPVLRS